MSTIDNSLYWCGVAEVAPKQGNALLDSAIGAFVAVGGLAPNLVGFVETTRLRLDEMGFLLIAVEDVSSDVNPRMFVGAAEWFTEQLCQLRDCDEIVLGTFQSFH